MPPERAIRAIARIQEPDHEILAALWRNMPSPYEIDVEDRDAAMQLLRAVLSVALQDR